MGITESNLNREDKIQKQYKLIRRYTCPCYGELTVIQNKITKEYFALKEFVSEDPHIIDKIIRRRSYRHPNIICLTQHWVEAQASICSNLKKVGILYQYYERNLDEELNQQIKRSQKLTDTELTDLIWQFLDSLNYLQEKGIKYLINGLKSIKISEKKQIKILESEQSLLYGDKNITNALYHCSTSKRNMPLHPSYEINQFGGISLNKQSLIIQNIFTIGIIVLSFCHLTDPSQLGIYNKGTYSFQKIYKKREQISQKYPKTYFHLCQMLKKEFSKNIQYENLIESKIFKENSYSSKDFKVIPIQKVQKTQSKKRLTALQVKNIAR